MKNELKLKNSILINNKEVDILTYDIEEITAMMFAEADVKKKQAAGIKNVSISPAVEFDFGLHMYVGIAAVLAVNPEYTFDDLERMKGFDLVEIMKVGRNFFLKSEEDGIQNNSEEQSENTLEFIEQE